MLASVSDHANHRRSADGSARRRFRRGSSRSQARPLARPRQPCARAFEWVRCSVRRWWCSEHGGLCNAVEFGDTCLDPRGAGRAVASPVSSVARLMLRDVIHVRNRVRRDARCGRRRPRRSCASQRPVRRSWRAGGPEFHVVKAGAASTLRACSAVPWLRLLSCSALLSGAADFPEPSTTLLKVPLDRSVRTSGPSGS